MTSIPCKHGIFLEPVECYSENDIATGAQSLTGAKLKTTWEQIEPLLSSIFFLSFLSDRKLVFNIEILPSSTSWSLECTCCCSLLPFCPKLVPTREVTSGRLNKATRRMWKHMEDGRVFKHQHCVERSEDRRIRISISALRVPAVAE